MPGSHSLDPETRVLYGSALRPPPGYTFDAAVATTFSLDFETALSVPVALALFAAESRDEVLNNPLALLEAAERIAGRLFVFADSGHLHARERPHSRLCSLLERVVVEVSAPRGGAFHPKIWFLRYRSDSGGTPRVRLLVLSRNLTQDRCWDTALTLDGEVGKTAQSANAPVADLLRRLPGLAVAEPPASTRGVVDELANDVARARWELPEGFDELSFAINGLSKKPWRPGLCKRLGVISPFCDDAALSLLANLPSAEMPRLISRPDQLAALPGATLDAFDNAAVLDAMAITEDGEGADAAGLQGLHAKVFIAERGWDTSITVGSGNATRPALVTGHNVEVFATLTGKRSRVGNVAGIMGPEGFGRLTRPFVPGELGELDASERAAEHRLDAARRDVCAAGLRLRCRPAQSTEDDSLLWNTSLIPRGPLALDGIGSMRAWSITRGEAHARDVAKSLAAGTSVDLGPLPLVDLTRFLAFEIVDGDTGRKLLFSTALPIDGLPAERDAAILRTVICDRGTFLRYLRLLLADTGNPFATALALQESFGHGTWRAAADDAPLLEEMVRAFCHDGDQLRSIERLIARLDATGTTQNDPVPTAFRTLWETFRTAMSHKEACDGR